MINLPAVSFNKLIKIKQYKPANFSISLPSIQRASLFFSCWFPSAILNTGKQHTNTLHSTSIVSLTTVANGNQSPRQQAAVSWLILLCCAMSQSGPRKPPWLCLIVISDIICSQNPPQPPWSVLHFSRKSCLSGYMIVAQANGNSIMAFGQSDKSPSVLYFLNMKKMPLSFKVLSSESQSYVSQRLS